MEINFGGSYVHQTLELKNQYIARLFHQVFIAAQPGYATINPIRKILRIKSENCDKVWMV